MAHRRMVSKQIVDSDAFLDMPTSSQLLYFHLLIRADDEGFVGNPKKVMREIGITGDDFKILVAKRFLIMFESGVVVIKHWLIHNTIRMDRFNQTSYQDEKNLLTVKENKAYTEMATTGLPNGNQMETQVKLSKVNLSKDKEKVAEINSEGIPELIKSFESLNPASKKFYGNINQRKACRFLIDTYTLERVQAVIEKTLPKTNGMQFFPTITTPLQLQDKWVSLESAVKKYQAEKQNIKNNNKVAF